MITFDVFINMVCIACARPEEAEGMLSNEGCNYLGKTAPFGDATSESLRDLS